VISVACALFAPHPPPTETDTRPPECAALDLTPEECANQGTHSYAFKTEFACTSVTRPDTEKFSITFSATAMELEMIEPGTWSHQYEKVSRNTYVWSYAGVEGVPAQVTLEFTRNGFTMSGSENPECGKYIQTLLP
jgi:hypothetical protein